MRFAPLSTAVCGAARNLHRARRAVSPVRHLHRRAALYATPS